MTRHDRGSISMLPLSSTVTITAIPNATSSIVVDSAKIRNDADQPYRRLSPSLILPFLSCSPTILPQTKQQIKSTI